MKNDNTDEKDRKSNLNEIVEDLIKTTKVAPPSMTPQKRCFVIAPIGEEGSETREHSDKVYECIILPVVEKFGYTTERADQILRPGQITLDIIRRLIKYELVIADLTDANPNVYFELAVRYCYRKPWVQICKGGKLPFDIQDARTIFYSCEKASMIKKAKDEICEYIKVCESDQNTTDSIVSVADDHQRLVESKDPLKESVCRIESMLLNIDRKSQEIIGIIRGRQIDDVTYEEIKAISDNLDNITRQSGGEKSKETIIKEIAYNRRKLNKVINRIGSKKRICHTLFSSVFGEDLGSLLQGY